MTTTEHDEILVKAFAAFVAKNFPSVLFTEARFKSILEENFKKAIIQKDIVIPEVDEIDIETTAGTLTAYTMPGSYGPQIGIMHRTVSGDPTDIVLAEVCSEKENNPDKDNIHVMLYEDIYTEDWTSKFKINGKEIEQHMEELSL